MFTYSLFLLFADSAKPSECVVQLMACWFISSVASHQILGIVIFIWSLPLFVLNTPLLGSPSLSAQSLAIDGMSLWHLLSSTCTGILSQWWVADPSQLVGPPVRVQHWASTALTLRSYWHLSITDATSGLLWAKVQYCLHISMIRPEPDGIIGTYGFWNEMTEKCN